MGVLQNAITEIKTQVQTLLPGLQTTPYTPGVNTKYPFLVVYAADGDWSEEPAGCMQGLHNIAVEIHVIQKSIPGDIAEAMAYAESIPNLLFKRLDLDGWNHTIQTVQKITYKFGSLGYGAVDTLGFRFIIVGAKVQAVIA